MLSTGQDDFPSPAHHTIPDTNQDAIGLVGCLGKHTAGSYQQTVHQHTKVPFHQAAFQPHLPKPVGLPGVAVTKMQDLLHISYGNRLMELGLFGLEKSLRGPYSGHPKHEGTLQESWRGTS